jgi:hypothetical protein
VSRSSTRWRQLYYELFLETAPTRTNTLSGKLSPKKLEINKKEKEKRKLMRHNLLIFPYTVCNSLTQFISQSHTQSCALRSRILCLKNSLSLSDQIMAGAFHKLRKSLSRRFASSPDSSPPPPPPPPPSNPQNNGVSEDGRSSSVSHSPSSSVSRFTRSLSNRPSKVCDSLCISISVSGVLF